MYKKLPILAATNICKGEDINSPIYRCGYFLCLFDSYIIRFCTSVWKLNGPTALAVLVNGKGRTVFYFCLQQLKFSEMTNTEEQRVERVKNALFTAWQKLGQFYGEDRITEHFKKTIYLLNYKLLGLLCINEEKSPADDELSNVLFSIHCIYEFMESVEESLKEPIQ